MCYHFELQEELHKKVKDMFCGILLLQLSCGSMTFA